MIRLTLSVLVGAVLTFGVHAAAWMVFSHHFQAMEFFTLEQEQALAEVLQADGVEPGVYWVPGFQGHDAMPETGDEAYWEEHTARMKKGPVAVVALRPAGVDPTDQRSYLVGFLIQLVASGLIVSLLYQTKIRNYLARVFFVVGLGVLIGVSGPLADWNWLHFSAAHALAFMADHVVAHAVAGIVLAGLVPRPPVSASA